VIFNVVVSPTRKQLCNLRPSVSQFLVQLYYQNILVIGPLILFDVWVQMVVPSNELSGNSLPFSTLLANPAWECRSYLAPVLSPVFANHIDQGLVLFISPRPFDHCGV
jgi:hypothetical protein